MRSEFPIVYAHSLKGESPSQWEELRDHAERVASLATCHARAFGAGDLGRVAGLLHDFGKLDPKFQARLSGSAEPVDHATPGAVLAVERYGHSLGRLLAAVIAGHHTGLRNDEDDGTDPTASPSTGQRIDEHRYRLADLLPRAAAAGLTIPDKVDPPQIRSRTKDRAGFSLAFLTRMVFSALVDADFLATESFYAEAAGTAPDRGDPTLLAALRDALDAFLAAKSAEARIRRPGVVNETRASILTAVRAAGAKAPGVFTLTVPTGGGKTLASLAFALNHAIAHGLERVIMVIPFTSVVEQTAAAYREALGPFAGSVLEHHGAFDEDKLRARQPEMQEKLKLAAENWDARIIVTTAVQFFESLFADRVAKCRKLHRIARSVVILDEAQTLPVPLLAPTLAALDDLARSYRTTIVLCTATQPSLTEETAAGALKPFGLQDPRELAPDPPALFAALKRVEIEAVGRLCDDGLAERIAAAPGVLVIVNTRKHARELFERVQMLEGVRHLSTFMCAAHRAEVLDGIRQDLADERPCRVVSTSLIEAGVDVDFPLVLRAEAGLDQIAQAAGRCNREGRRPIAASRTLVFEVDRANRLPSLDRNADAMRTVLRAVAAQTIGPDLLAPAAMDLYFQDLIGRLPPDALDEPDIMKYFGSRTGPFPFETVAKRYRLIDSAMLPIIIPRGPVAAELAEALDHAEHVGTIARRLQRFIVTVPRGLRADLIARGAVRAIRPKEFGDQFVLLDDTTLYREDVGLDGTDPSFMAAGSRVS